MGNKTLSYHNDKNLKESVIFEMKKHQNNDTSSHFVIHDIIGIPLWLCKLQDEFFECLPNEESDKFTIKFLESIPVGVDLEPVRWKLSIDLLKEGIEIIQDKETLSKEIKDEAINALMNSLSLYESATKSNAWNGELSNDYVTKIERLLLKSIIYFPHNVGHIINMALKSLKIDENSMRRMFFSATMGSYEGGMSSEAIGNAYIGHSHQLLSLLKNAA